MNRIKINIVNEFGELICTKYRDEIDINKDIYQVSGLWVVNDNSEVLLAQRSLKKDNQPGKWGPAVAGTVEEGETFESNIYKEANEEIGLTGIKFEKGPLYLKKDFPRKYFTQWFIAKVNLDSGEFRLQEEEVENVKWINKNDLIEDLKNNPDNYIPSFSEFVDLVIGY
jgi:isopentenyldiphosphate isomerase